MKKRIISLILALALCVGMLPAPAWAEEPTDPTQAVEVVGAANPSEETDPTTEPTEEETEPTEEETEPTEAETEPTEGETEPTEAPKAAEVPAEETAAPGEDEAVAAVQAMIDALPDVEDMSESYLDALEAAYSAFEALSEAQQAQITGVEKLEALFGWVNSQVSTLAAEETISGEKTWDNRTFNTPVKLTGDTTLTLTGTNRIECKKPLDLNGHKLTIQGTGSLELVGSNNDGNYYNSGTIYDSTWTGTGYTGGGMVIESGTVIARADVYNAVAVRYLYMEGGKLEAYGARAGIVTTDLQIKDGSLYATGNSKCGINMYSAPRAVSVNDLNILVSNEPNAQEADMEDGTTEQIENSEPKTVAIGKFSTSPSISVQPQQGSLYEATVKTATFALSGRNVDLSALTLEWTGAHTGLEASADGKTLTVTTDKTVQAGTYRLKVSAGEASRTAVVTVSGPPICIYERPVDTICTDSQAGAVNVSAYLTDGHTGSIAFQWKQEDGTPMAGYTDETVLLYDLVEGEMLTQDESKPWLKSIRIYCTLSYDGYSLDTDTVTVGLNSCRHPAVDHEGNCLQCGQKKGGNGDALIVREDGLYYLIANAEQDNANVGHFMYSGGNFYLTGDVPNKTVDLSCTDVGGENVTLDLQGHTMGSLEMGNFPYGTFTVKNGTLKDLDTAASGKLILENILYQGKWFDEEFDLTVQGENTRFEQPVAFHGTTHLRGGHFDGGLDSACVDRALELLEEGFAFYDSTNKVVNATDSTKLVGREIHVAAHTCHYRGGSCDCGRSCDHQGTTDENGYCTNCGTFVYPFAIGEKLYTGLEAALTAAQEGDTVTLRGDYDMQAATVEIKKSITLELNGHTLSGWPYAPILTILAPDVTIQNGTVKNTDTSKSSPAVQVGTLHTTEAVLTVKNATFEGSESHGVPRNYGLSIFAGNTAQAENGTFIGGISVNGSLTLSGGKADHIYVGTGVTYASLLAKGYAYQAKGQLVKPENMADGIAVEVVKCGHPDGLTDTEACAYCGLTCNHPGIDSTTGNCTVCGLFQATASVAAGGTTTYFANFSEALEAAKAASGSTLTLFQDVALTGEKNLYIDSGTFTIDWNGHTLSGETSNALLCITDAAKVTLTDSVGTGGLRNTDGAAIGVYVRSQGSLTIQGGVYSPQLWKDRTAYGPIQISGGRFENPEDSGRNGALYCYSGALAELLAPGYTFAYEEDDSLFDVYGARMPDAYRTVCVVEHTHDSFDEDGVCACGYTCPHEHWTDGVCDLCGYECPHEEWKDGKCTVCGYPCPHEDVTEHDGVYTCDNCHLTMTVRVETADGISYTTDLAAALNNAEDGTTVKLLGDVSLENSAYIKDGKEVTLNLNGHNITRAGWQIIQVKGNTDDGTKAKLVITGSGEIRFNVKAIDGGQLDMSGWTGTVTCVDLENACDLVGPIGNGHLGELNISNWRSDNKGTILLQGGTIGKLWLNSFESFQMTLGSLLKSGCAAKSGSEYLPYDHAIQNGGSVNDLTIVPCPHTGLDSSGRCTYCNTTGFVATVTKNGVTAGYTDFLSALDEICDGKRGTLKLLKDIPVEEGHPFGRISGILDLNGKNLACDLTCIQGSSLQIVNRGSDMSRMERLEVWNGAKVTIADTAGSIHFNVVWVEIGSVADLLPEGGAYIAHDGTWISAADAAAIQSLENVAVKKPPVQSVTLTANKTTVPYGESQTVTLTASATLSEGATASYAWAELMSYGPDPMGEDEASFTLPAGVNAGEHTYRVSVTVGDYTLSEVIEITVTKAPGTLVNKNYPTEFTYGDTVPTPKAENFTSNHPDGTFSYYWLTGDGSIRLETGANPTRAGTYMLYATWTGGTNYTTASLSLAVTIQKAAQTANIAVVNETISGKGDGGVKLLPSAEGYEIREKGETTFEPIGASQGQTFMTLTPGVTYEIRLAETKNYLPSTTQEVTVQSGRKLKVTLPENQKGYNLTASKTQLGWHEDVELSFQLNSVGAYKAADFGIWAEAGSEKTKLTLGNDGAVKLTAPEKDITITVTGVKTDNREPKASIQGRQLTENSLAYVKWEGFQKNPADDFVNGDFVISAADRGSGVASIWYCLSDKPLTLEELKGMNGAFWARPANQGKVSITEDGEYYLYVKALDKANNVGYACTGKLVKESNPPTFSGVENGKTYYVSQQMEIHDDGMPDWYMAEGSIGEVPNGGNENPIKLRLPNNGSSYTFTVGDRCGNEATITVYMKPLSDLTQPLDSILEDTIRKSDRATLDDVEATLKGLDVTYATEPEKKEINDALARIAQLRQVLDQVAAVEAQIAALPDSVEPYQQTVEDTQIKPARQAYSDLTDHQKTLVDSTKLDKLVRLEAQLNAWTITEGDGQTWYKGSWNPLSFTVNGQTRKFSKVLLDGKMHITATPSFLAVSGSIDEPFTLTLKPEFLQVWMEPGEHTLTVIYGENNSGTGTVTFTVEIPANYLDVTNKPEFDGKTTVTVDGAEYPIEEMNGTRYVNLPETGDLLTIYSFKDGTPTGSCTNYPIGMQVFRITRQEGGAKAEEITEFANLLNYAGCSIRLTGTKGIRMITGIGENARTALTGARGLGGYTLEEYGTVVMRGVGTPTLENSKSHNFAYKKGKADPIFSRANGMIQYTNVLVGFSLEDCKDTLTLRPYIKLRDMTTGETVTLYGGCVSRSIGYIAKQNENTYKPGTAGYKYIYEIIDAVYGKTEQGGETK